MRGFRSAASRLGSGLASVSSVAACGKLEQKDPNEQSRQKVAVKRQQTACGSSSALEPIKGLLFDQAIKQQGGDQKALDTLADFSFVRMENAVVTGSDEALDITRCRGHLILEVPAGARAAFSGEQHLGADVDYTAQAAADGNGFVYRVTSPVPFVAQLARFHLNGEAYRPPAAFDQQVADTRTVAPTAAPLPRPPGHTPGSATTSPASAPTPGPSTAPGEPRIVRSATAPPEPNLPPSFSGVAAGEDTVRRFYSALGTGDGALASNQVVPEKRTGRIYSPAAISRFYGKLPGPLRLTSLASLGGGAYRASYQYSTGRARCNGVAVVRLATRDGRQLIKSISAPGGC